MKKFVFTIMGLAMAVSLLGCKQIKLNDPNRIPISIGLPNLLVEAGFIRTKAEGNKAHYLHLESGSVIGVSVYQTPKDGLKSACELEKLLMIEAGLRSVEKTNYSSDGSRCDFSSRPQTKTGVASSLIVLINPKLPETITVTYGMWPIEYHEAMKNLLEVFTDSIVVQKR